MLYNVLGQVHVPDNDSDDDLRAKEDVKVRISPYMFKWLLPKSEAKLKMRVSPQMYWDIMIS